MTCSSCGAVLQRKKSWLAYLVALVLVMSGMGVAYSWNMAELEERSGFRWDEEMRGPWADLSQTGVELYRIHIINQNQEELNQDSRMFRQGDKLVGQFHFRVEKAGTYRARVRLEGPVTVEGKESVQQVAGGYGQFKGLVLPLAVKSAPPGEYLFKIEIANVDEPERSATWSAPFLLAQTPGD